MNSLQQEILIGKLLGDGSISKVSEKTARFNIGQSIKQEDYVNHLYDIFKDMCGTPPRKQKSGEYTIVYFNSLSSFELMDIYKLFVNDGIKGVPQNIEELLTARGLAYWFMDDGTSSYVSIAKRLKTRNAFAMFCTDAFNDKDIDLLRNALFKNFGIKSSVASPKSRKGKRIYIGTNETQKLFDIIEPFIVDSMSYKIKRPYIL